MNNKKIANIVFYKPTNYFGRENANAAYIFYDDGTFESVSYDEGIDACQVFAKEHHITSKDAFQNLINNNFVHVISETNLKNNFSKFIEDSKDYENDSDFSQSFDEELSDEDELDLPLEDEDSLDFSQPFNNKYTNDDGYSFSPMGNDNSDYVETENQEGYRPYTYGADDESENEESEDLSEEYDDDYSDEIEDDYDIEDEAFFDDDDDYEDEGFISRIVDKVQDKANKILSELESEKSGKSKQKRKKASKIRLAIVALAIPLVITGCSLLKKAKKGNIEKSNITKETLKTTRNNVKNSGNALIYGNNDFYDDYTYEQLLEVTDNKVQKTSMQRLDTAISGYNGTFADAFVEAGKDVRAGLKFDEVAVLQQAYNDYSKEEIKGYFNGISMSATTMEKDYKAATLQLMGAHVIETRENPVDMSMLLNDNSAKEFYNTYHEMLLAAKEATGEDQLAKVQAFRNKVREDFPITREVRTEGIMHRDAYDTIESYKLSVVPMIAAEEMMFQNLATDNTLSSEEIDFLNDIGLCNYAQDKFEKIEAITNEAEEDNTNPLYEQYRRAMDKKLAEKKQLVTTDAHRDVSSLDRFQNVVNWHFAIGSDDNIIDGVYYTTDSYTTSNSWTETSTSYREEITTNVREVSGDAAIDAALAAENAQAKAEAEKAAEAKREELQTIEDKKAEQINAEIKNEEKDLENKITNANNQINQNNSDTNKDNDNYVNEKDFGEHNVDFNENYSDSNGYLNDSVENITTDGTGDQTGKDLPDPNATGAEFDKQSNGDYSSDYEYSGEDYYEYSNDEEIIEYEEEYIPASNEELVNQYIASLEQQTYEDSTGYSYTK